jgi:hypothetical protein
MWEDAASPCEGGAEPVSPAAAAAAAHPRFTVHPDHVAALKAGLKASADRLLFTAALPYEAKAKYDEDLAASVHKALAPALAAGKLEKKLKELVATAATAPPLDTLPLDVSDADAAAEEREGEAAAVDSSYSYVPGGAKPTSPAAAAADASSTPALGGGALMPAPPPGLTATDDALRDVYARAYFITRRLAARNAALYQEAEHAVGEDTTRTNSWFDGV